MCDVFEGVHQTQIVSKRMRKKKNDKIVIIYLRMIGLVQQNEPHCTQTISRCLCVRNGFETGARKSNAF